MDNDEILKGLYDFTVLGSEGSQVVGIASQDDRTAETNGGGDDGGVHSVA